MNLVHQVVFLFGIFSLTSEVMSNTDINTFFPQINGNLSKVTWAHAVNNMSFLETVLKNADIMMIEADVLIGTVNDTNKLIPIMGHPPSTTSNLSLEEFLKEVEYANSKVNISEGKGKGVKLDFKSIEAFEASLSYIADANQKTFPVWINADILAGPGNSIFLPVDSTRFLTNARTKFSDAILSIGWTTMDVPNGYTNENIKSMIDVITKNKITNTITYPVRACLTAHSHLQMKTLLEAFTNSTLTIWSSPGDKVDVENLRKVILDIGVDKIFIDVPQDLKDKLHLDL